MFNTQKTIMQDFYKQHGYDENGLRPEGEKLFKMVEVEPYVISYSEWSKAREALFKVKQLLTDRKFDEAIDYLRQRLK